MADYLAGDTLPAADLNWTTWTPTLTNITQGNGTVLARYIRIGNDVRWKFRFVMGSTSAMGTGPQITLPAAPADTSESEWVGWVSVRDVGTGNFFGPVRWSSGSTVSLNYWTISGANLIASNITSTAPMTWTTNDVLIARGFYEAA